MTTPSQPPTNLYEVGYLLYEEHKSKDTQKIEYTMLFFIDEVWEYKGLPYIQLAVMGEFSNGLEVFTAFEAGSMPRSPETTFATDELIAGLIRKKLELEGEIGIKKLANWVNGITTEQDCETLLDSEKQRLKTVIEKQILEMKGDSGITLYRSLLGKPYWSEN